MAAAKAIAMVARLDDWLGRKRARWTASPRAAAQDPLRPPRPGVAYLGEIERDQGAVLQLTPEGIDLFDAAVADRAGIDYGCVLAAVPEPRERIKGGVSC